MRLLKRVPTFSVCALVALAALSDPLRRPLTPEDVVEVPQVSDPRISPDGTRVAFVVTRLAAPRRRTTEVWVVPTRGGEPERVPVEQGRAPRWSPEGDTLALVAPAAGGEPSVHLFSMATRTVRVVPETAGAREVGFSPDGARIAFLRPDPPPADEAGRAQRGEDARVLGEEPSRHTRLWIVERAGGAARRVLQEDLTVWRFGWSPDGRRLAVLASTSPLAEGQEYGSRLLIADLDTGKAAALAERTSPQAAPAFSADGRWISYLAPLGSFKERGVIHVVPAAGGEAKAVASSYAGSFWEVAWHPREPRLLAALGEGTQHALATVDLEDRVQTLARMRHSLIPYWEPVWSVDAAGKVAALLSESEAGREVWAAELQPSARETSPRRLTRLTSALEETVDLGAVETVSWTNPKGGARVEGVLVSPPGPAPRHPRSLVVWLHGGPAYHWGLGAHVQSWARLLAAQGFLVLLPNFRGSTGYGQAWLTANVRDWGQGPMDDVMSGVDDLVARGLADPERLYVGGGSYGGYLTYWIVGHTTRFRAAYLRAGISDPFSGYALTDEPSFFVGYFGAAPYDDPDIYRALAPLSSVGAVRTPTLIVHGEQDARVPLSQSLVFHAGLQHRRVPSRLVVYPREGHSILERAHQLDHMSRLLEWFRRR